MISLLAVGCSSVNAEKGMIINQYLFEEDDDIIDKGYKISGVDKGEYQVTIGLKEYKKGKLERNEDVITENLNLSDNGVVYIKFGEEEGSFAAEINGRGATMFSEMFSDQTWGIATSILEEEKSVELNNEIAICGYSMADEKKVITSINIDEEPKLGLNDREVIAYVKLEKKN